MQTQEEIWKDVIGYEGLYEISNYGRIKSIARQVVSQYRKRTIKEKILKNTTCHYGYTNTCLSKYGDSKLFKVHRLVAIHFIPNPENKPQVNHKGKNPNKKDNRVWMLEWVTNKENADHFSSTNLRNQALGEKASKSKLTEKDVLEIRALKDKLSNRKIAKIYNVTPQSINAVLLKKTWRHI